MEHVSHFTKTVIFKSSERMNALTAPYTKEQVKAHLEALPNTRSNGVRLLFVPTHITEQNLEQVCNVYREVQDYAFDTVVIVEPYRVALPKKIPMASFAEFFTPFGSVPANEKLRDEFCDEDDDFFIDDSGVHPNMSFNDHLGLLKIMMDHEFSAVSVQLADDSTSIVRELSSVISELIFGRNILVIFCCDLQPDYINEFEQMRSILTSGDISYLMNYTNSGNSKIDGVGVFVAGAMVAKDWEIDITFLTEKFEHLRGNSLIAGFAGFPKN